MRGNLFSGFCLLRIDRRVERRVQYSSARQRRFAVRVFRRGRSRSLSGDTGRKHANSRQSCCKRFHQSKPPLSCDKFVAGNSAGNFGQEYYGFGEISSRSICVASRSPLGGGCTTNSKCVPVSRCIFFFAESNTVPCDPSEVGVYTFTSGRPKAPLLSGVNIPSVFSSPSAADAAKSGARSPRRGLSYTVDTT